MMKGNSRTFKASLNLIASEFERLKSSQTFGPTVAVSVHQTVHFSKPMFK